MLNPASTTLQEESHTVVSMLDAFSSFGEKNRNFQQAIGVHVDYWLQFKQTSLTVNLTCDIVDREYDQRSFVILSLSYTLSWSLADQMRC
ncbi:MAG: hypothetical protein MK081_08125 [Flavobacteriales bacterium]|nr:hypothetical protein [Flavobacteriales bacterium]